MFVSSSLLTNSFKNLNYHKEKYSNNSNDNYNGIKHGSNAAVLSVMVVISIIFFILEFLLLFYCIIIALKCTEPGPERVIHIVLAVMFTLPYALINVVFNKCAIKTLRSKELSSSF